MNRDVLQEHPSATLTGNLPDDRAPAPDARKLRIVYVGQLDDKFEWTCSQRMRAQQRLGHEVTGINVVRPGDRAWWVRTRRLLQRKLLNSRLLPQVNRDLIAVLQQQAPDILWIDKGLHLSAATLQAARRLRPHMRVAGYSPDDMLNPDNQSREFLATLPLYDVFFSTKSYHVQELCERGCPRTVFVDNAYDPELHHPLDLTPDERRHYGGPVGFIGGAERERAQSIARLADAGIPVRVWGDGWESMRPRVGGRFEIAGPGQHGLAYIKVLCAFDINLCFLRKVNRDLQTTRSMEIPACGAFMLAERTAEHRGLFEENVEAAFFGDDRELIEKVRYYLAHADERTRIAAAGRARCVRDGYGNYERMRRMLAETLRR